MTAPPAPDEAVITLPDESIVTEEDVKLPFADFIILGIVFFPPKIY
jgi:hypothetical protein